MPEKQIKPDLHPDWIDSHALGIVKALQKGGHTTYLVGGCVRDLLLNIHPKDYDIVTAAHPPQIKRLIHMAFIIGKRFRLVLVKRGTQQYEVATFRKEYDPTEFPVDQFPDGPPSEENIFGTPEEDAKRRDFTINALFYDPISGDLIDFVGGQADIDCRTLRMIGEPAKRLQEDPIRILRALRFAHKLGFAIEPSLRAAMAEYAPLLATGKSVLPRRREELLKILRLHDPAAALVECFDLGVLRPIFPFIDKLFDGGARQDTFLAMFEKFRESVFDSADTGQLFAWLITAIVETYREEGVDLNEDALGPFMRDELGMYKFEQSLVADCLKMIGTLEKSTDLRRRGERRQSNLARREGFALALRLARADYRIDSSDYLFWIDLYEKLRPEIEAASRERKAARPRRRRPPRGGKPARSVRDNGEGDSTDGDDTGGDSEPSQDETEPI